MAQAAPQPVEIDPDFEPLSRPRSCTWPLPRPEFSEPGSSNTSSPAPSVKQEPGNVDFINNLSLLEETETDYADSKSLILCNDFQCQENCIHRQTQQPQLPQQHNLSPQLPHQQQVPSLASPAGSISSVAAAAAQRKSSSSRRNAWGNMSYADLITKAIESSPEKRLTLSQIYDWMVKSVPYFKDKGDSNSSAGWKNSIRHNLSLHSRFVRVQNEGTGKSSWWMLNPEGGKSGKSPRRRAASMDNNSKFAKSRGRAAKKKALQGGADGGADSPGSQYPKWLGSPNSHSNDDFETWTAFRTRASSDASTLSGRRSPFLPEQEELSEGPDLHRGYPGPPGAQMPSLTEVSGSLGHRSPESMVIENMLDNFRLLSPKNQPQDAQAPQASPMLQGGPGYPSYGSPGMPPQAQAQAQQGYRKCLYGQAGLAGLPPIPMQSLSDTKPGGYGPYLAHYNCPAGLLKELLTSDPDPRAEPLPSIETVVSQSGGRGGGGRVLPPYSGQGQVGHGLKMLGPHPHPHLHHPRHMHPQLPPPTAGMNGSSLLPPGHAGVNPGHHSNLKSHLPPASHNHQAHLGGGGNIALPGYCTNGNGYIRPGLSQLHHYHHHHHHHPERLPSDLDDMSIERFECDMESVLHDTLMDGDSLDFNFDPMVNPQGFPHGVKTTTHSWVSG